MNYYFVFKSINLFFIGLDLNHDFWGRLISMLISFEHTFTGQKMAVLGFVAAVQATSPSTASTSQASASPPLPNPRLGFQQGHAFRHGQTQWSAGQDERRELERFPFKSYSLQSASTCRCHGYASEGATEDMPGTHYRASELDAQAEIIKMAKRRAEASAILLVFRGNR